eukprot:scaffold22716_cov82-Cylindrotheca_fusiformis.AAC.1
MRAALGALQKELRSSIGMSLMHVKMSKISHILVHQEEPERGVHMPNLNTVHMSLDMISLIA